MITPLKAECTECNQKTDITLKERKHPRGIHETYFKCDNCHAHTTCFVTNAKVRKLHREIDVIRNKRMRSEVDIFELNRKQRNVDETMFELKAKYGR